MHVAPPLQSEVDAHWVSTRPEQPDATSSVKRKKEAAVWKRTEDGRSCTGAVSNAFGRNGIG